MTEIREELHARHDYCWTNEAYQEQVKKWRELDTDRTRLLNVCADQGLLLKNIIEVADKMVRFLIKQTDDCQNDCDCVCPEMNTLIEEWQAVFGGRNERF